MSSKDVRKLLKELKRSGFEIEDVHRSSGVSHHKVRHPDHPGKMVTMSATPSDHRAIKNMRADLRREFGWQR